MSDNSIRNARRGAVNKLSAAIVAEGKRQGLAIKTGQSLGALNAKLSLGSASCEIDGSVADSWSYRRQRTTIRVAADSYSDRKDVRTRSFAWDPNKLDEALAKVPKIVKAMGEVDKALRVQAETKTQAEDAARALALRVVAALKASKIKSFASLPHTSWRTGRPTCDVYLGQSNEDQRVTSKYAGIVVTCTAESVRISYTFNAHPKPDEAPKVIKAIMGLLDITKNVGGDK